MREERRGCVCCNWENLEVRNFLVFDSTPADCFDTATVARSCPCLNSLARAQATYWLRKVARHFFLEGGRGRALAYLGGGAGAGACVAKAMNGRWQSFVRSFVRSLTEGQPSFEQCDDGVGVDRYGSAGRFSQVLQMRRRVFNKVPDGIHALRQLAMSFTTIPCSPHLICTAIRQTMPNLEEPSSSLAV